VLNVKKSYLVAFLAVGVAVSLCRMSLTGGNALAQRPGMAPPAAPTSIALIDINYIFKQHPGFKAEMEQMKSDVQRAEAQVKADADAARKFSERMADFHQGTPEYKQAEEELVRKQTDIQVRVNSQKKEFLLRESQIYNRVYQEIYQEVAYYCNSNGIGVVVKFNGDPLDADRPDDVLRVINQQVVYHAKQVDITGIILQNLRSRLPPTADGRNAPGPVRPAGVYAPGGPQYQQQPANGYAPNGGLR
jgi:Skp family chaperone for outer membrane proteins